MKRGMHRTIAKDIRTEQVISKSRFICSLKKVKTEEEAQEFIKAVKKEFWDATHNCSAYVIDEQHQRSSDDGEPSGSAGRPILGQIDSLGLSDVLVVVVRYFGGIKLGIPGLIRAYKSSTADALSQATVIEKIASRRFRLHFDYLSMNAVMKVLKEMDLPQSGQQFGEQCSLEVRVRLSAVEDFMKKIGESAKLEEI